MAASGQHPSLAAEIGPDGIAREAPVIAYTEKIIEQEQLQLKKYIRENYSKIREVEQELENLTLELKLTAGPKKAALEHMRKKIELSTERIRIAKLNEDQAKKVWEDAVKVVKDEEAIKQKLCEDLNRLVQESSNSQFSRLEELKRRLEALNPSRPSTDVSSAKFAQQAQHSGEIPNSTPSVPINSDHQMPEHLHNQIYADHVHGQNQSQPAESDGKGKKRTLNLGRGKNVNSSKGKGSGIPGWTGAGFDVDGRT